MAWGTLALLFPQWQGSSLADPRGLFDGAKQLRNLFPDRNFIDIDVHPEKRSEPFAAGFAHAQVLEQLERAHHLLEGTGPERVLTLGGDCSVDIAPVAYLNECHDDLAVLWLDAHPDLNTPESSPSGALHGMVLRLLLGEGDRALLDVVEKTLEPEQVFLLGVRDFDPPERAYAEAKRLRHFGVRELEGRPERLVAALKRGGFKKLHLHFDLDVLDPAVFAATGYPTVDGLSLDGTIRLLAALEASFDIVGTTLTEYLPQRADDSERDVLEKLVAQLPKL